MISLFLSANGNDQGELKIRVNVARSFDDIASETIISDTFIIIIGFALVFNYVALMLGKFSCVENRVSHLKKSSLPSSENG